MFLLPLCHKILVVKMESSMYIKEYTKNLMQIIPNLVPSSRMVRQKERVIVSGMVKPHFSVRFEHVSKWGRQKITITELVEAFF